MITAVFEGMRVRDFWYAGGLQTDGRERNSVNVGAQEAEESEEGIGRGWNTLTLRSIQRRLS